MIDLAVARIEDVAVLVDETLALHALDDGQAKRRRILLVALAAGADRMRVFAGIDEHFGDGAFVNTIMLKNEKPAADSAFLVDLRPHAGRGRLGRAQRTGTRERGHKTGHDDRQKPQLHHAAPDSPQWTHALYIIRQCVLFTESTNTSGLFFSRSE